MDIKQINILVLAYIGDAIYELKVREYLIGKKINKVNDLQNEAKKFVSATSQSKYLENIMKNNILSIEEIDVVKRARNSRVNSHPKNTDILTYKHATALEALIGHLYLQNNYERMNEIINIILEG